MRYYYNICGVQLQLNTPREMWVESASETFRTAEAQPDVLVDVRTKEEVTPAATLCGTHREKPVWRNGQRIFRGDHDLFREKMHCCTEYDLTDCSRLTCHVREEDWLWATRSKYLWPGIGLNYILLHRRGLVFHASCIDHEGKGLLFTAPSGTGKSTQAELWRIHRGARIVNGDKAGITLRETPMVHGVPFSGTSGICENVSLPLSAVVVLSQAPENSVRDLLEDTYEMCRVYNYDKLGIQHESDAGFGKAYDIIKTDYLTVMKRFFNMDYNNILACSHEDVTKSLTKKSGEQITRIAPNLKDILANKIAGMVDLVARIIADDEDKRTISFKADNVIFGGGRLGVTGQEIPLDYDALMQVYENASKGKVVPQAETVSRRQSR